MRTLNKTIYTFMIFLKILLSFLKMIHKWSRLLPFSHSPSQTIKAEKTLDGKAKI